METNLRPLTLGEILDRTAQLYRSNFALFFGIAAVYAGVVLVLNLMQLGLTAALPTGRGAGWVLAVRVVSWISLILIVVIGNVTGAATARAVAWVHLDEPATIAGAYRSVRGFVARYLWLGLLKVLIAWSPMGLLYGGFAGTLLYFQAKGLMPRPGAAQAAAANAPATIAFGLAAIAFVLLFFPALIYGTWMALRYALALPACVVEELRAREALKRSVELSKGSRGSIFVLWLLVAVIEVALVGVTQMYFIAAGFRHHFVLAMWLRVLQQVISFFTNSFVAPLLASGMTLFYFDQRVRKEGYDIEWMMQAAGMTLPAAVLAAEPAVVAREAARDTDAVLVPVDTAEAGETETAAPAADQKTADNGHE